MSDGENVQLNAAVLSNLFQIKVVHKWFFELKLHSLCSLTSRASDIQEITVKNLLNISFQLSNHFRDENVKVSSSVNLKKRTCMVCDL